MSVGRVEQMHVNVELLWKSTLVHLIRVGLKENLSWIWVDRGTWCSIDQIGEGANTDSVGASHIVRT